MKFKEVQHLCQRAPGWAKPVGHGVLDSFALELLVVPVSEATVVLSGLSARTACRERLGGLKHRGATGRDQQLKAGQATECFRYPR